VRRTSLSHMACSVAKTADIVGDPWTLLIVRDALVGVTRFDDLQRRLGTPRATLTNRLSSLVDAGVLTKVDGEYRLTEKGRALRPVIVTLMQWGDHWVRDDEPPTRLVEVGSGRPIRPVLVDRETGVPLDELSVRAEGPLVEGLRSGGQPAVW
jgi:DNA-binding HxlR family transcriptional regulator